ncbi:hypothetical protein [Azohydromonas australica]|uniref:hypothetical protein n=1 Tax=Azohydromonas australica TaxID=364039 RepID=UPI0003F57700|nr:hypothetical protein [Azohydromonas australica]
MSPDPQLAAWRLARAGKWERFERVLRKSPAARTFIRMLPYQMYFDGYQRAEHIARVIEEQERARSGVGESQWPRIIAVDAAGMTSGKTGGGTQEPTR